MRRILPSVLCVVIALAGCSLAQSGAVIPEKAAAGHAEKPSCVLLKRMGPADQVTSRLYSFGIRGKQFQYIEGKLPEGFPFHGRLTDHDVRNMQARGAEVIVLSQNYTPDELKQARADCQGVTGQTPMQADAKAQASDAQSTPPSTKSAPAAGTEQAPAEAAAHAVESGSTGQSSAAAAQLQISSDPAGADIEIDGNYVGNTPSNVGATVGQHQIALKKSGFKPWERKIIVSGGQINVNASLEPESKP